MLADILTADFGVGLTATATGTGAGHAYVVRPTDLDPSIGFSIEAALTWRTLFCTMRPGPYAGGLISELGASPPEARSTAAAFFRAFTRGKGEIALSINRIECDPSDVATWPAVPWSALEVSAKRLGIVTEELSTVETLHQLAYGCAPILGAVLALAQVEEIPRPVEEGLPEGARISVVVNRYERSRVNRAACIAALGSNCMACGLDFSSRYGALARGFIHVHHVNPVSEIGDGYVIDPTEDLVPVCPNCHAVMHMRTPPLSVSELQQQLTGEKP
jgi:5-methylcytosine-specific restriction enzyme A